MTNHRPQPPDSLNFELTDFEEARNALDQLPEGLVEAQRAVPDYWDLKRRAPLPTDRALTGNAMDWVMHLPPGIRPAKLCEKYPRVANAISLAVTDPRHYQNLLAGLLADRRGHRKGFSTDVRVEIERLLAFSQGGDPNGPPR